MSVKPHLVPSRGKASPSNPPARTSVVRTPYVVAAIIAACSSVLITLVVVYKPFLPPPSGGESPATAQANVNATAIAIGPPIGFSVATLHPGQVIKQDTLLKIKGKYSSEGSGQVWVVLEDNFGNYYLQSPSVQFNGDGTWTATNVNPGSGITMIDFVYVTSAGSKIFQQMVAAGEFGAFSPLPDSSKVLQALPIQVI